MMSLQERLAVFRSVADMAIEGRTDEEIARETGIGVNAVGVLRVQLGIRRRISIDIMKDEKLAKVESGTMYLQFRVNREYVEDLGLDSKAVLNNEPHKFSGEIKNGKLIITIKEGEK